jgi:hypothetical protein
LAFTGDVPPLATDNKAALTNHAAITTALMLAAKPTGIEQWKEQLVAAAAAAPAIAKSGSRNVPAPDPNPRMSGATSHEAVKVRCSVCLLEQQLELERMLSDFTPALA